MRRSDRHFGSLVSIEKSTIDPNKFYSILLDARAASVSENMCDIAEKLLQTEKENARVALNQLNKLRNNLFSESNPTIDLLLRFYEDKLDVLKEREDRLKKVSVDSRSLLEDKRHKDEEIASVKQQVTECSKELDVLTKKLDTLKVREQELTLIEHQLREELNNNENEIINGLYEIILSPPDEAPVTAVYSSEYPKQQKLDQEEKSNEREEKREEKEEMEKVETEPEPVEETVAITSVFEPPVISQDRLMSTRDDDDLEYDNSRFPKSVVKTHSGKIIGEYHYDATAYKNERHYIFHTRFFADELIRYTAFLKKRFDPIRYSEMVQMIQDAQKRISDNKQLHFEVATNEILNEKTFKRLYQDAKLRSFDEIEHFAGRLQAKIEALGTNYESMLMEQMQRCLDTN